MQREKGRKVQAGQVENGAGEVGGNWMCTHPLDGSSQPIPAHVKMERQWKAWTGARAPGHQGPPLRSFHRESEPTPERPQAQVPCKINSRMETFRMNSHQLPLPSLPALFLFFFSHSFLFFNCCSSLLSSHLIGTGAPCVTYRKGPAWKSGGR